MKYKNKLQKAGLIFISLLLSLFLAEVVLYLVYPQDEKLYVWQPNLHHTFHPDSTIFYGVNGASNFTINPQGFRGNEFRNNTAKRYLCIGGSTTECLYLDDEETWCARLEQVSNKQFQIGSIGKSGCTTREHFIQTKYFVPQVGKIDGIVLMVGLNDMMKRLSRDSLFENDFRFTHAIEDSFVNQIFLSNKCEMVWWRKLQVFQLAQNLLHRTKNVEWENIQDDRGEVYKTWRSNRQNATKAIDSLPDFGPALSEFERNLQMIYDETQKQGFKLVLVNQATLYRDSLNEFESSLLWMGGVGDFQKDKSHSYYSSKALNVAMQLYNERMKEFCSNKPSIKFIDLAAQLPKDTSVFYDDCHFNERGAKKVAEIISISLLDSSK